ncbi:hypothetical protein KCH_24660 [Kitasatospora cheerisanensis KCTC 2395]|uniref:Uncharacterized protein n=1 Tax=Kitasatospora cheerisanensis KCTC 2395 TaxID=1348663 RepID=A0A066YW88_9ACTN|nr:hypothetical protein KCH_24660 [Kitasatospora cheerisanensis KCTC 2395]
MARANDPAVCPQGHPDTVKLLSTVAVTGAAGAAAPAPSGGGGGCCGAAAAADRPRGDGTSEATVHRKVTARRK